MACPNRKKDDQIIAEYNRRKLQTENTVIITESNIIEGDIFAAINTFDLNRIISIIKAGDNSWEINVLI